MSFLTEYFDEYREYPINRRKPCLPDDRWAKMEGIWLDPKHGKETNWSEEEIDAFIKKTMRNLRGQSTYFNEYCAHLDPTFKTRPFVPKEKKKRCPEKKDDAEKEKEEEERLKKEREASLPKLLALKDTELWKQAKALYGRDLNEPCLEPLKTYHRLFGYTRTSLYHTGLSEYQANISRLAYELVRDDRIKPLVAANGSRPRWGYPPEGVRQPLLDGLPFDGERLND